MWLWLAIVLAIGWVVAFAVYHVTFAAIHVVLFAAVVAGIVYFVTPDSET
jgi:hypothetical protein